MTKIDDIFKETFLASDKETIIKDILFDADAIISLVKEDDSNHKRALNVNNKIQEIGVTRYISPFTIAEVVTVLSHKASHSEAKKFLEEVRKSDYFELLSLKEEDNYLADKWFFKQTIKGVSYFDCYNMALMERYKNQLGGIFSFDEIYKKNGFKTFS